MHQQSCGPNSVQVGHASNSPILITQENHVADSRPRFVKLEFDRESIQQYPKAEVDKRTLRGASIMIGSFLVGFSPHFADLIGIFNQFGIPSTITVTASVLVGFAIVIFTGDRKFINWRLHGLRKVNGPRDLGAQTFLEIDNDGNYIIYSRSGSCTYPHCDGKVIVINALKREIDRGYRFVGICSVEGRKHAYVIDDYNAVAREAEIDY